MRLQPSFGSPKVCAELVPPLAITSSDPPFATGSPTTVSSVGRSCPRPEIFRCVGAPGFFTWNFLPKTFCALPGNVVLVVVAPGVMVVVVGTCSSGGGKICGAGG